ncbi:hypothetical protein BCR35DRAFT_309351 [Leucosporidium creatinivorum]|uniref:Uncharacterized protein n=1 Tax=Leucosporidium creatinivorum TaxID=106004 RepID=A0A1Y2DIG9_9BASI|nr:hypothetical protein BCR35DRAFT_309351 [Leucosporidium creatinivorum]
MVEIALDAGLERIDSFSRRSLLLPINPTSSPPCPQLRLRNAAAPSLPRRERREMSQTMQRFKSHRRKELVGLVVRMLLLASLDSLPVASSD